MCGIVGAFYKSPQSRELVLGRLGAALESLQHRGPDGQGTWIDKSLTACFGHTRLAIIDTSDRAAQPMVSADGRYVSVFNGEIYNFKELKKDLQGLGISFRTESDTEVAIEAYRMWGVDCLNRFRGMFAIALFDTVKNEALLARDPLGKKPFLIAESAEGIAFSSELPALAKLVEFDLSYDLDALASMLVGHMRHIPDPWTAFRGVRRLLAGHAMFVSAGRVVRTWRYWTPRVSFAEHTPSARVRFLLDGAVERRLRSDVPLSVLLSGGVDSTAIAAIAQARGTQRLASFAYGTDSNDPDIVRARIAAKAIGTDHTEIYCGESPSWELLMSLLHQYGEPIALLPLLHAAELSQRIREKGMKVVLSGNGADEIFYGYEGFYRLGLLSRIDTFVPRWLFPLLGERYAALGADPGTRKAMLYRFWAEGDWPKVLASQASTWLRNRASEMSQYWGEALKSDHYIDESAFVGLMVENTHSVTTISDLAGMMHGVEIRSPFLDVDLVECALLTHFTRKVGLKKSPHSLKLILREAVSNIVPAELLNASKRGFGMSIQERDLLRGKWRRDAARYLEDADSIGGLIDSVKVRSLWKDFLEGNNSATALLARVLTMQLWVRHVVENLRNSGKDDAVITGMRSGMAKVS